MAITPVIAQERAGDVAAGHQLAKTFCGACHRIDPQQAGVFDAPGFPEIAELPSTTALSLNVFLRTSHRNMPNFQLARAEAEDVVAYILSLKGK